MVLETKQHPEQLKDDISSPAGTSAHALHKLEQAGFRGALIDAVEAGTLRSKEIGSDFNNVHLKVDKDDSAAEGITSEETLKKMENV